MKQRTRGEAEARVTTEPDRPEPAASFDRLYAEQWWPMLRLATGLVDEAGVAEDVVQDAFTAVYRRWASIRDRGAQVGYLRVCVVNAARSALRRKVTARKHLHLFGAGDEESADRSSVRAAEHDVVRRALNALPDRQREVLTLRYIAELSDTDIAAATGLSLPGVRSAASRGLATLRSTVGDQL